MSLADVQRLIHNNSSRLPCDGLTLNCYVFSKMQLEAYRCKLAFKFMDTIEALKTQVPNLTHTSGISTCTLETGGRSSKQAKPTDLPQVAKISNFPENKNTKAHGPCMHAYYQCSHWELLMHFPFTAIFYLQFGFPAFCPPHNLSANRTKRCHRSLPLRGFLQCHACSLPPQTTESKGRKEAAQVHYDRVAIAGVHMTN